jgi:hypothetical protein
MLQDSGRSRVIACHSREIGNILLLLLAYYYHMEYIWIINGDRAGLDLGFGLGFGWATKRGLRLHLFCLCWLRAIRCTVSPVKSQIYCHEHILAYGSRKACYSLVMGSGSFQTDYLEAGIGGGLSTTLRLGLKVGAWSPSLDGYLEPVTGVERVGLACA